VGAVRYSLETAWQEDGRRRDLHAGHDDRARPACSGTPV